MKQAVMTAPGKIEFEDVPIPEPLPGQVLLRVSRIGICGSDVHVYHGTHRHVNYPLIQGHEVTAEIVEVGNEVWDFSIGQRVTVQPQSYCGKCYQCTHGNYHICKNLKVMGFQLPGCACEFIVVPAQKLIALPANLSSDHGALIEPIAVAVHALGRTGSIRSKKVLVLGAGTIGNLVAQTAAGLDAESVIVTDLSNFRLELAGRCGVAHCLNSSKSDVSRKIEDIFGADRADVIFDCAGVTATMQQATDSSRKGTDIVIVAVFPSDTVVDLGAVQRRELRLIGTHMYQKKDFELGIDLLKSGKIMLEPLITTHFDFKDYLSAYRYIDEKKDKTMKVIIHL